MGKPNPVVIPPDDGFEDEEESEKEYAELEAGESKGNSDWRLS